MYVPGGTYYNYDPVGYHDQTKRTKIEKELEIKVVWGSMGLLH